MIKLATATNSPLIEVRPLKRTKFLAIHRSVDYNGTYDITHIPTGFRCCNCDSLVNAKRFLERIKDFAWNFKSRLDRPKALTEQVQDASRKFKEEFGYSSVYFR